MGPKPPHATVLTKAEAALSVTCRRQTRLPVDDGLDAWPSTMPHLTRSALHRWWLRHGINRWPAIEGDTPQKKTFQPSPMGYGHIDMAEGRTEAGTWDVVVAIDRPSKVAYAERHTEALKTVAAQVLRHLSAMVPDQLHTVRTDHGLPLTNRQQEQ
jgi:hypothetical protein